MRLGATAPPSDRARREAGFTLVELIVVCALLAVTLAAAFGLLTAIHRTASEDQERTTALVEDDNGLHAMTGELRRAYKVVGPLLPTASSNYVDVLVRHTPPGQTTTQAERVLYRCDVPAPAGGYRQCVRYSGAADDPAPAGTPPAGAVARVVVARLVNGTAADPVFSDFSAPSGPATRPAYLRATVKAPAKGERATSAYAHAVVLDDAVYLRNLDVGR